MNKSSDATPIRLRQIVDDEEAYSEIPVSVCAQCGIGLKHKRRGDFCYVRGEDAGWIADSVLQHHGFAPKYTQHWVPSFGKWIKSDEWPAAQEWAGGQWPEGSAWREARDG